MPVCQPVIQMPHFDESALSRSGPKGPAQLQPAVEAACSCLRVVPGTIEHTKGVTGLTRLNEVVGG